MLAVLAGCRWSNIVSQTKCEIDLCLVLLLYCIELTFPVVEHAVGLYLDIEGGPEIGEQYPMVSMIWYCIGIDLQIQNPADSRIPVHVKQNTWN